MKAIQFSLDEPQKNTINNTQLFSEVLTGYHGNYPTYFQKWQLFSITYLKINEGVDAWKP